jgi:TonB family protein
VFCSLESSSTSPISLLRRYRVIGSSIAAHIVLLVLIVVYPRTPIEVTPTWLANGNSSHTYQLIYVAPAPEDETPLDAKLRLPKRATPPRKPKNVKPEAPKPELSQLADAQPGPENLKAGTYLGRVVDGPIVGHEVHVAYPVVYPDPPVDRADLPRDLVGDVVIEVTIDSGGNVVETKVVQAIGHGIDEKIVATLRRWHYQPATLDGTPVASHHDVHFHFPS